MELELIPPEFARAWANDLTGLNRPPEPLARTLKPLRLELPDDAYFEYAFIDADGKLRTDPANPLRAHNPWYAEMSAVKGPDYAPDPLYVQAAAQREAGIIDRRRLQSKALGQPRRVQIYTPAGFETEPLPTVLVQDGPGFLNLGHSARVLDALIKTGRVPPARLVLIEPIDRLLEYRWNEPYQQFVLDELLPQLGAWLPGVTGLYLLGASLGGLVSATLALREPDTFLGLASLSGAFLGTPENPEIYETQDSWLLERIESGVALPERWFVATGTLEWLADVNRSVATALARRGSNVQFVERSAGHNWTNWRNQLGSALTHLLECAAR